MIKPVVQEGATDGKFIAFFVNEANEPWFLSSMKATREAANADIQAFMDAAGLAGLSVEQWDNHGQPIT